MVKIYYCAFLSACLLYYSVLPFYPLAYTVLATEHAFFFTRARHPRFSLPLFLLTFSFMINKGKRTLFYFSASNAWRMNSFHARYVVLEIYGASWELRSLLSTILFRVTNTSDIGDTHNVIVDDGGWNAFLFLFFFDVFEENSIRRQSSSPHEL